MIYLSRDDILTFNQRVIFAYGGRYVFIDNNILNNNSLEYLLDIVDKSLFFGKKIYKTRYEVAAEYSYYIIKDHIFHDGCKRTGILSAQVFLARNGTEIESIDEEIKQLALDIEADALDKKAIAAWFRRHKS